MIVGIIDYGLGNLRSVVNAFQCFEVEVKVCGRGSMLEGVDRFVLPGVGAFDAGMAGLEERGFIAPLEDAVRGRKRPFLGLCLGLQLLFEASEEGEKPGLGWIPGRVSSLKGGPDVKVPHMGWNEVRTPRPSRLLAGLPVPADFYFVHSYCVPADKAAPEIIAGVTDYGFPFVAALEQGNVMAAQFHPEKSQLCGMKLIENFVKL